MSEKIFIVIQLQKKQTIVRKRKNLLLKCGFSEVVDGTVTGCHGISGTIKTDLTLSKDL